MAFTNKREFITYACNEVNIGLNTSTHAEENLVSRLRHHKHKHGPLIIMSLRVTRDGTLRLAKCCADCIHWIERLHKHGRKHGQKRGHSVRAVIWSVDDSCLYRVFFNRLHVNQQYELSSGRRLNKQRC